MSAKAFVGRVGIVQITALADAVEFAHAGTITRFRDQMEALLHGAKAKAAVEVGGLSPFEETQGRFVAEDKSAAQKSTTAQEQATEAEEQPVGGAKIGRSSPRLPEDQKLPPQEQVLREHGSGPTTSQDSGQTGQELQDQPEEVLHLDHVTQEHDPGKEELIRFSGPSNCQFAMHKIEQIAFRPGTRRWEGVHEC